MKAPDIGPDDVAGQARSPLAETSLLADALHLAGAFAFEMGEDGHLDFADKAAVERFLVERTGTLDTSDKNWRTRLNANDERARQRAVQSLTYEGARYQLDYPLQDGMGETRYMREIAEAVACADGRATLIRGVFLDRTDDVKSEAAIAWRARQDPLTRLPNKMALIADGTQMAELAARVGVPAHLLRLRLTNLDLWAENFGGDLRDHLLRVAATRLQDRVRAPDLIARLDGNDFAVCSTNSDPETLGQMIRAAISTEPCQTPFGPLSLEVALAHSPLESVEEALSGTQHALSGDNDTPSPNIRPEININAMLEDDQISLAFQPIVEATTGVLHHHECLLRVRGDDVRMESAFPVILAAEADGLVHLLDLRALDLAMPYLQDDPTVRLALNVSAGTVANQTASDLYIDRLRALGEDCQRIILEMTETLAVDDPAQASSFSAEVRALGCQFAIDDFGSGHTSFRNLLAIEADSIKIDGSLVRGVAVDENKQAFIRMMVDLAATFSVQTVAEMVEDRADAQILARLGVDHLQGYYFGRPAPSPIWSRMTG